MPTYMQRQSIPREWSSMSTKSMLNPRRSTLELLWGERYTRSATFDFSIL